MSARAGSFFLAALLLGLTASSVARADDKCTIATKGNTPTAQACAKGGRPEAKKLMKQMVNDAKKKGEKFTCDGCHKDLDNYALTDHAEDDYKKLEAVLKK
ncbi:MAG TPA: hypothetical protein VHJ20_17920 [Polyangia bacterium]|nr:hypothetical protein [Polyangia bacterium]